MPRQRDPHAGRVVYRTARVGLRLTRAQRRRCIGLLVSAGDVWSCVLEVNAWRRRRGDAPLAGYQPLCRELAAAGPGCLGELDSTGARSVLRRYSDAWFAAAKRRRAGDASAGYPRRRRLLAVRYYHGTFALAGRRLRAGPGPGPGRRGRSGHHPPLRGGRPRQPGVTGVRSGHPRRAPPAPVRHQSAPPGGGRSRPHPRPARLPPVAQDPPPGPAGRDPAPPPRPPGPPRGGHRRHRLGCAAARGTLSVGDPRGVLARPAGRHHNLRLRQWQLGRAIAILTDKAERAGITVRLVDERGTSSTCPACRQPIRKPRGRTLTCRHCGLSGHRDLLAAATIATRTRAAHPPSAAPACRR